MNVLFASEMVDVEEMGNLEFCIEDNNIVFYTKVSGIVWNEEKLIIGKYNVVEKHGYMACIQKEYKSLKALYNRCNKLLESYNKYFLSIDYKKIEETSKQLVSSIQENEVSNKAAEDVEEEKEITINDQISEVISEEKQVREESDKLYNDMMNHRDHGKPVKEWSNEYNEMNDRLNMLEKKEDEIHNKRVYLMKIRDTEQQKALIEAYGNNKYKVIYKDGTILYTNTYDYYNLNIKRVETLIRLGEWFNRVNVLEHKTDTNTDILRSYEGAFLTSEKQVMETDRKQVINESYYRKDSNLSCNYFGLCGVYRISYHNAGVNLITIDIDAKTGGTMWYHGTMFNKCKTDKGVELFKRLKEKYSKDQEIKRFFDMVKL